LNLFVTDPNPTVCAINLDDKRIGKLLMECNQMMSLAVKSHWPEDDGSYVGKLKPNLRPAELISTILFPSG
jgi:hypothetical protein